MDFTFSPEQEDLRREARSFLDATPSPSMDQLRELGWVGVLQSDDFSFLDAAVLFEELGRSLYDGPYVFNEVAGQPGDETWSIEVDGFVQRAGGNGELKSSVDEVEHKCQTDEAKKKRKSSKTCRPGRRQNIQLAIEAMAEMAKMQAAQPGT